nr:damage-control phosphatase ARMT1-like isoform X1 [Hydra vulgaris]
MVQKLDKNTIRWCLVGATALDFIIVLVSAIALDLQLDYGLRKTMERGNVVLVSRTFAYLTIKEYMPGLLDKVIDYVRTLSTQYKDAMDSSKADDAEEIISKLCMLKDEILTNQSLRKINDTADDNEMWNKLIENTPILAINETEPTWLTVAWLHCQCYMYRRIIEVLLVSKFHTTLDPYRQQKSDAFQSSIEAMQVLAGYLSNFKSIEDESKLYESFEVLLEYSLWSNKCDLSILVEEKEGEQVEENDKQVKSSEEQNNLKANIISNHTDEVWAYLNCMRLSNEKSIITFVLDNAGFELFSDLCLADFLLTFKFCTEVHFHVKCIPWFVSDTTAKDFFWTIEQCVNSTDKNVSNLGKKWVGYLDDNLLVIIEEKFWTSAYDYSMLEQEAPSLYSKLSKSKLIMFKGDLNYRKLVGDLNWPYTTDIKEASSGFFPAPWCTLRTLKADIVVGLDPGVSEELDRSVDTWMNSGDYGVVQCCI